MLRLTRYTSATIGPAAVWLLPCPTGVSPSCWRTGRETQVMDVPVSRTAVPQTPRGTAWPETSKSVARCAPTLTRTVSVSSPARMGNVNCGTGAPTRSGARVRVPGPDERETPDKETYDTRSP